MVLLWYFEGGSADGLCVCGGGGSCAPQSAGVPPPPPLSWTQNPLRQSFCRVRSVLVGSGWFWQLARARSLRLCPAPLGGPVGRQCCGGFVVRQRLQGAVPVVAGRAELAATVGAGIRKRGRRRRGLLWMRRTVGLSPLSFDLGQLRGLHRVTGDPWWK